MPSWKLFHSRKQHLLYSSSQGSSPILFPILSFSRLLNFLPRYLCSFPSRASHLSFPSLVSPPSDTSLNLCFPVCLSSFSPLLLHFTPLSIVFYFHFVCYSHALFMSNIYPCFYHLSLLLFPAVKFPISHPILSSVVFSHLLSHFLISACLVFPPCDPSPFHVQPFLALLNISHSISVNVVPGNHWHYLVHRQTFLLPVFQSNILPHLNAF